MPTFPTPEDHKILEGLQASYRISILATPVYSKDIPRDQQPKPRRDPVNQRVMVEILTKATNQQICVGYGPNETTALHDAVMNTQTATMPMTPGELVRQNREQAEEIRRLKGQAGLGDRDLGGPTGEQRGLPERPMKPADLAAALEARGITLPEGDRRTGEWKEAANLLQEHDEVAGEDEQETLTRADVEGILDNHTA